MNVDYLDYDTRYRFVTFEGREAPPLDDKSLNASLRNKRINSRACFREVIVDFENTHAKNKYVSKGLLLDVEIKKDLDFENNGKNHIPLFKKAEIELWLRELRRHVPFQFVVENKKKKYLIRISANVNYIGLKFLVTGIRYLYELPMAPMLKDSMSIRKYNLLDGLSLINILLISHSVYRYFGAHALLPQDILPYKLFDKNELLNLIRSTREKNINNVLSNNGAHEKSLIEDGDEFEIYDPYIDYDCLENKRALLDYYKEEKFKERFEKYYRKPLNNVIKILKEKNNE